MNWRVLIDIQHPDLNVQRRGQRIIQICLILIGLCSLLVAGIIVTAVGDWLRLLPILALMPFVFGLIIFAARRGAVTFASFGLLITTWLVLIGSVYLAQRIALTPFFFLISILVATATMPPRHIISAVIASVAAVGIMGWLTREIPMRPPERIEVYALSSILLIIVGSVGWAGTRALVKALQRADAALAQSKQLAIALQHERDALSKSEQRLDYLFRRFVAPSVADQILMAEELPELGGQRRTITILFADLRHYTKLAEQETPETVTSVINDYFSQLGTIISRHGGTITHFAGDQIMALYNAPTNQPDHAERAVQTACKIQEHLLRYSHKGMELELGIGINTGPAVVGYIGIEQRYEYTAIGDSVNIAARLCALAQAGAILISNSTQAAISTVATQSIGQHQIKGKRQQLEVHRVVY